MENFDAANVGLVTNRSGVVNFNESRKKLANMMNPVVEGAGADNVSHVLVQTTGKAYVNCFVCNFMTQKYCRTCLTCIGCKKGYHANCFVLFHSAKMSAANPMVLQTFFNSFDNPKCQLLSKGNNKCTPTVDDPLLPHYMD
jgi:hypothetical protein